MPSISVKDRCTESHVSPSQEDLCAEVVVVVEFVTVSKVIKDQTSSMKFAFSRFLKLRVHASVHVHKRG